MNYLSTSFKDFIKINLIEETKKEQPINKQLEKNKIQNSMSWIKEMKEEFEKITNEYYDNLHKH